MMRHITTIVTTMLLSFALGLGPIAQAEAATDNASGKFGRGVVNIMTGWMEVFNQIIMVSQDENPFLGITVGTVKGVGMSLARTGSGLFDVLSFYAEPYDEPLVSPEYLWAE